MSKLRSLGRGLERLAKGVIRSPLARAIPGLGQVASVVQTVQEVRKAIPRSAPRAPVSTVSSIRSFENSMACGFEENADLVGAMNVLAAGHAVLACGGTAQSGRPAKQEPAEATTQELALV